MYDKNKDIQAKMKFIVEQQARFAANIQAHDERLAKLESIVTHLENVTSSEREEFNAKLSAFSEDFNAKLSVLTDAQVRTEEGLTRLAESQAHTDRRLDALIDSVRKGRNGKSKTSLCGL